MRTVYDLQPTAEELKKLRLFDERSKYLKHLELYGPHKEAVAWLDMIQLARLRQDTELERQLRASRPEFEPYLAGDVLGEV